MNTPRMPNHLWRRISPIYAHSRPPPGTHASARPHSFSLPRPPPAAHPPTPRRRCSRRPARLRRSTHSTNGRRRRCESARAASHIPSQTQAIHEHHTRVCGRCTKNCWSDLVAIRSFRSISGNPVALTNAGMEHIAKRHPELKNVDLADKIGIAIESPDYVVQGKFGRHIAVR